MGQERGLRPLFPELPDQWLSRAIRVAMSEFSWAKFDHLVAEDSAPTRARAVGRVLTALMVRSREEASAGHWLDFERDKARRLLGARRAA